MAEYIKKSKVERMLWAVIMSKDERTIKEMLEDAPIVNAISIPDDATNGDMIKALFPKLESREKAFEIELNVNKNKIGNVSAKMWNAPYKSENWVNFAEELKDIFEDEVEE